MLVLRYLAVGVVGCWSGYDNVPLMCETRGRGGCTQGTGEGRDVLSCAEALLAQLFDRRFLAARCQSVSPLPHQFSDSVMTKVHSHLKQGVVLAACPCMRATPPGACLYA